MFRIITLSVACFLGLASEAPAQVFVRAPFVRVFVDGPYWNVRAPFVNIGSSSYYAPGPVYIAPPTRFEDSGQGQTKSNFATPSIDEFARTFQATPGSHEVTLINPVTGAPTTVSFTLPDGYLRQIRITANSIEFNYGLRRFVRIDFDQNGATVFQR